MSLSRARWCLALLAVVVLAGCASAPRVALAPESKQKIKRVALVEVTEPEKLFLNPGSSAGGSVLYMFGALGGAILGGIEAARAESATNEFMATFAGKPPTVGSRLTAQLDSNVAAKGYSVTRIPALGKAKDEQTVDCGSHKGQHDAVLLASVSAGYVVEALVEPRVVVNLRMMSSDCSQVLFSDTFVYSHRNLPDTISVLRGDSSAFASRDLLIASPDKVRQVLLAAVDKLASRAVEQL